MAARSTPRLEPGDRRGRAAAAAAGPPVSVGGDRGLLPGRGDQPGTAPSVLGAVADREDGRVVGAQLVVDDDAAVDLQPGRGGPGPRGRTPQASTSRSWAARCRRRRTA